MLRAAALALLAAAPAGATAAVTETGRQRLYEVHQPAATSLLQALNQATPVRGESGQVFFGYTEWQLHWKYRYRRQADGVCKLTAVDVTLDVTTTLPEFKTGTAQGRAEFERFLPALVEHEEGHRRIGQETARDIDAALSGLEPMASCALLEAEIARLGSDHLERSRRANKHYDETTRHGCTQGACVNR
ncbi:DUF922 domain-containing protein [Pelomonas aquatica]|uniref:DUF922 domain-containing protein n=1 Tax=Pelomonas aquatica TaxID=431058 RepID=UPI00286A80E6|nr:DUF922 domain-containing protein [Pelomonas aquatica]